MKEKVNAVVEAVAAVVAAEQKERSKTVCVGAVDVDFLFVFHQLTETDELIPFQCPTFAQFQ